MTLTKRINTLNHYLFFIGALLLVFMLLKDILQDLMPREYEPPKIELVDNNVGKEAVNINYSKHFQQRVEDVYVFSIKADLINNTNTSSVEGFKASSDLAMFYGGGDSDMNTVNLLFAKEGREPKLLFDQHTMIVDYHLSRFTKSKYDSLLVKNAYLVVSDDTNKDGFLSESDNQTFFVSQFDGTKPQQILQGVESMRVVDDNLIYLEKGQGIEKQTYFYRAEEGRLIQLNTRLQN